MTAVVDDNDGNGDWAAGTDSDTGSASASAANILQNVGLFDGTTQIGKYKSPNATTGSITFTGLNWKIPKGQTKLLLVKANLSKNANANNANDQVGIILNDADNVTAENSTGDSVSATLSPTNGPNTNNGNWASSSPNVYITVAQNGTLTVSAPPTQVEDQIVIAGQKEVKMAIFKVKSQYEDFTIKKLTLNLVGANANRALHNLIIKYPTGSNSKKPTTLDGKTTVPAPQSGNEVKFDGLNFKVPKDNDNIYFEVYGDFQSIQEGSTNGAQTGDTVSVSWPSVNDSTKFEAVGEGSGTSVYNSGSAITSNKSYLRRGVPTIAYVGKSPGTISFGTEVQVAKILIKAVANNIDLYKLTLNVSANGLDITGSNGLNTANGWKIYDSLNDSTLLASATYDVTNSKVSFTFTTPKTITPTGKTYIIKAPVKEDDSQASKGVLGIKVAKDAAAVADSTAGVIASTNSFVWSDRSAASHSVNTGDWTNGYKLTMPGDYFYIQ